MANEPKDARSAAETKFRAAQKTTDEAKGIIDTDLQATRKKTARPRQQRLAKEAAGGELDKKARPAKKPQGTRGT